MGEQEDILRRYSEGEISRYDAMAALDMDDFAALDALLVERGLLLYEPPEDSVRAKLARLRAWQERGEAS